MARSRREIAFVKRLARYLSAALPAELVWNWPERWSEWKEIGRVKFEGSEVAIDCGEEYLDDDHQMRLVMRLPAGATSIAGAGNFLSIGFNEEIDDATAGADYHFDVSDTEERKKNSSVGFEAILYGRKREEEE